MFWRPCRCRERLLNLYGVYISLIQSTPNARNYIQFLYLLISIDTMYKNYSPNGQFLYNNLLSNHIHSLSILNQSYHFMSWISRRHGFQYVGPNFYDFYSLFNNYLATSAKCLSGTIINVYRDYNSFYIGSAFTCVRIDIFAVSSIAERPKTSPWH